MAHCWQQILLELYNDKTPTSTVNATQYGIADMSAKTFSWISGLPEKDVITYAGIPMVYDGKIYLPITEIGQNATLCVVNTLTAKAT